MDFEIQKCGLNYKAKLTKGFIPLLFVMYTCIVTLIYCATQRQMYLCCAVYTCWILLEWLHIHRTKTSLQASYNLQLETTSSKQQQTTTAEQKCLQDMNVP